jgi:uncharacterized damage-inducible protein DinB
MTPTIVRDLLVRDLRSTRAQLEDYPDETALWTTTEDTGNSAGTLALHVAGNLRHFVGALLGDTGYVRDRDAEFARRDVPRAELLAGLEAAERDVVATLDSLDPARLEGPYPFDFNGKTIGCGLFLSHLTTHLAYHLGQIDGHRRRHTGRGALRGVNWIPFGD